MDVSTYQEVAESQGRVNNDAYQTPPELCNVLVQLLIDDGLLPTLDYTEQGTILEPSAGIGNFVRAMVGRVGPGWIIHANDIGAFHELSVSGAHAVIQKDFLDYTGCRYNLIIGNPPFIHAEAHIRHALKLLRPGGRLAFLLRLGMLGSKKRSPLWRDYPAERIYVLSERPSYVNGGTDNSEYGFFVWQRGHKGTSQLEVISWK